MRKDLLIMIDWSTTAAWITLAFTLAVSVISPIITTWMNHRFQLKMAELESCNKEIEQHYLNKRNVINSFIANVGKCLFRTNAESLRECGESFYAIYVYIPQSMWGDIDELHRLLVGYQWEEAQTHFLKVSKQLADILEESDRPNPPELSKQG